MEPREKSLELVLGRYDDPDRQRQGDFAYDLYKNNLAIIGTAMSGKTTLLKTLLIRLHQMAGTTEWQEVYILDFKSDLRKYKELPYVTAYLDGGQEENIRRVFKSVEEKLKENIDKLAGETYIASSKKLPHITFIIDGLNSFLGEDSFSAYHESFQKLSRDGLSKGLTVIFTANEPSGGVGRLLPSYNHIVTFDLQKDKYTDIYSKRVEKPIVRKGRGLINGLSNYETEVFEFQAYLPANSDRGETEDKILSDIVFHLLLNGYNGAHSGSMVDSFALACKDEDMLRDYLTKNFSSERQYINNREILKKCFERKIKTFDQNLLRENWASYKGWLWEEEYKTEEGYEAETEKDRLPLLYFIPGLEYYNFETIRFSLQALRSIAIYGKKESGKSNLLSIILECASWIPNIKFVIWDDKRKGLSVEKARGVGYILDKCAAQGRVTSITASSLTGFYKVLQKNKFFSSNVFTVFIIQSRLFYVRDNRGGYSSNVIDQLNEFIGTDGNKIFIFSDVQKITDPEWNVTFNNLIDVAFLLDDIVRFINDRGQKSVFGAQDVAELKEKFGPCELGDGYYFDPFADELHKMKFVYYDSYLVPTLNGGLYKKEDLYDGKSSLYSSYPVIDEESVVPEKHAGDYDKDEPEEEPVSVRAQTEVPRSDIKEPEEELSVQKKKDDDDDDLTKIFDIDGKSLSYIDDTETTAGSIVTEKEEPEEKADPVSAEIEGPLWNIKEPEEEQSDQKNEDDEDSDFTKIFDNDVKSLSYSDDTETTAGSIVTEEEEPEEETDPVSAEIEDPLWDIKEPEEEQSDQKKVDDEDEDFTKIFDI